MGTTALCFMHASVRMHARLIVAIPPFQNRIPLEWIPYFHKVGANEIMLRMQDGVFDAKLPHDRTDTSYRVNFTGQTEMLADNRPLLM